ncbi:unnamed protein product [Sphenostylis stenocarpa]|uniref:Uncharacterized protein n=1 Tax=Sphenostylis stenocarpa TaxID=92480 RepID=A0AA86SNV2_9FABA|nr:unnamed protein product [Sphenostylis stenocarpa]
MEEARVLEEREARSRASSAELFFWTQQCLHLTMVSLSTWFRYVTHKIEYSFSIGKKAWANFMHDDRISHVELMSTFVERYFQ